MKLYTQDRSKVTELPKEIWVTSYGVQFAIIGTLYTMPVIALYDTEQRAKAVLKEIFEHYRNGKNSYVLPER